MTDFDKASVWFTLPVFSVTIVAAGVVMAWLTLQTGSLWPAVIFHGSQNAITQAFFAEYTSESGNTAYYVSEVVLKRAEPRIEVARVSIGDAHGRVAISATRLWRRRLMRR